PAAATPELFIKDGKPMDFLEGVVGGRSVGTPGVLRALELAHRQHGKLAWKTLFQPAIALAEQGFALSPRLHAVLMDDAAKTLRNDPAAAAYFLEPDGTPKRVGTLLRNPQYAAVLRDIAERGPIDGRSLGHAQRGVTAPQSLSRADDRSLELASTSHISVVDGFGNAIAMTTTIENVFVSQIMVRGFLLNNELTDFSFVPNENGVPVANRVEGGKRPRSSMSPMLVFDRASGALVMSVGSPGGSAIINYVGKVLIGTLDWGLDVQ